MQKVLTAAEMREVDRLTTEKYGVPSIILMENAAHAVVRVIMEKLGGSVEGKSILVLCGKGNNGGDGAAVARLLAQSHADVQAVVLGSILEAVGDARINFEVSKNLSITAGGSLNFHEIDNPFEVWGILENLSKVDCVVDALFGTGLTRPLDDPLAEVIESLNRKEPGSRGRIGPDCLIVSIDIPSGLASDEAELVGAPFDADITVTFTAPKSSNVIPPASEWNGELIIAGIGSPRELVNAQPSRLFLSEQSDAMKWLNNTAFSSDSYKNKRGHALIIAGSENYSGAAVLCGNAAIRSGVGLVTIGTPRSSKDSIAGRVVPEVMVRPLAETEGGAVSEEAIAEVEGFLKNVDAIAIGSGLSAKDGNTERFVRHFVENSRVPTILDADALTLLSPFPANWPPADAGGPALILTPHQGEFLKMLGTKDPEAIKDRVSAAREFAGKHNVILVLKGERNLIAEPGGKVVVNPTGNSGLGKAGNGDTLTGMIAGFAAQAAAMDVDMFETVVAAVYIAGLAGDIAEKKFGKRVMTASDVKDCLGEAFEAVGQPTEHFRNSE